MSSSDSDAEGRQGFYQPVLALNNAAPSPKAGGNYWPRDGVSVYSNELFTDGADEAGQASSSYANRSQAPGSAQKMQQQKTSLAARRAERMQANIYQSNDTSIARNPGSPAPRPPGAHQRPQGGFSESSNGSGGHHTSASGAGGNVYGLASTYDPLEEEEAVHRQHNQGRGNSNGYGNNNNRQLGAPQYMPAPVQELDLSDLRSFLMQPGPMNGPVLCYIVRDKGSAKMYPKYNLFLEDGKRFLLAARKRKKQTTSNYLVSLDYDDLGRESEKYFGKLRANFVGTEFTIFDDGIKANKKNTEGREQRQELGCITYQYNVLGTRGPRKMTAAIPAVDESNRRIEATNMLDRVKLSRGLDDLVIMRNKPPRWNEELNAYCLNFSGRVTEASVKNFQLVTDDNQNYVILQFGKIGKNTFTMDYQWPMSAFQAFCICLSSFDNKLACE